MSIEAPETEEIRTAKLFMNGRSQAVRLPKEFRFEGDKVVIKKVGNSVVLEPLEKKGWPEGYFESLKENAHLFKDFKRPPQGDNPPIKDWCKDL